jgi:hypothetical protein
MTKWEDARLKRMAKFDCIVWTSMQDYSINDEKREDYQRRLKLLETPSILYCACIWI